MAREEASGQFRHHPLLHTPTTYLDHLWLLSDETPPIILRAVVRISTHPPSYLDHLWLLPDLSSVTPLIILSAVVRISARGYFAMRSTVEEDLQILSLLGLSLFGPLLFGFTLFGRVVLLRLLEHLKIRQMVNLKLTISTGSSFSRRFLNKMYCAHLIRCFYVNHN